MQIELKIELAELNWTPGSRSRLATVVNSSKVREADEAAR